LQPEQTRLDRGDQDRKHLGETHTFTRVAQFGGGVVPLLNDLSGGWMKSTITVR